MPDVYDTRQTRDKDIFVADVSMARIAGASGTRGSSLEMGPRRAAAPVNALGFSS